MEIQTISSLAGLRGLGAVPASVRTYGDATAFIDTLFARVDAAHALIEAASTARKINPTTYNGLIDQVAALGTELNNLAGSIGAQSQTSTLSAADAASLATADLEVAALEASASIASKPSTATWILVGLAAIVTTGGLIWAANQLPSYARKRRRRR